MALFRKTTQVRPETFIEQESAKALGETSEQLGGLFSACKVQVRSSKEVAMLSGFMPLLAMSLARLDAGIQRGYATAFGQKMEAAYGNPAAGQFQERTLEYLSAFGKDISEGHGDKFPSLMSAALNNICGTSDETVGLCRLGLLQFLLPSLRFDVEVFGELKFVGS